MWFCGCCYSSAWKGTPVCQALCGSLSDRELMSKIGRASSRGREEGMEQERLAQPGEEKQGSRSQRPKGRKLWWRAVSRRGRWALEQRVMNGWIWPAKTVQNTLASDPAVPAAVLPVLAFARLLPEPKAGGGGNGVEYGERNMARASTEIKGTFPWKSLGPATEGRKMAL